VRQAYEDVLRQLYQLELDRDRDGEKAPLAVRLTPEAKTAWVEFYNEWAREQAAVEGERAAAYSKLEAYAARLALLHHLVSRVKEGTDCDPIEPASIQAGAELSRWFAYEARRIYATLRETEDDCQVRRLIEFIRSHGGTMTARRLRLSNTSRSPSTEAAEQALEALAGAGLAEWQEVLAGPQGGRPSPSRLPAGHVCLELVQPQAGPGEFPSARRELGVHRRRYPGRGGLPPCYSSASLSWCPEALRHL
jgi:hypothetical protein